MEVTIKSVHLESPFVKRFETMCFLINCILLQGFYGEVYQGLLNSDQVKQVAVKRLRPEMYHKYQQEFDNEFRTMIRVQHPNCVRIIGQCINKDKGKFMFNVRSVYGLKQ